MLRSQLRRSAKLGSEENDFECGKMGTSNLVKEVEASKHRDNNIGQAFAVTLGSRLLEWKST